MKRNVIQIRTAEWNRKVQEIHDKSIKPPEEEIPIKTEEQLTKLSEKMNFETEAVTDEEKTFGGLILTSKDYEDGNLQFIVQEINEENRKEYGGKKFRICLFATDKNVCKRTNRWLSSKLEWQKIG